MMYNKLNRIIIYHNNNNKIKNPPPSFYLFGGNIDNFVNFVYVITKQSSTFFIN
uniref:Uncharacterized protein n=1 Tax=viral metagenome TaxID=1070528 RepID=A0A6C0H7I3_9ZZZZ